MDAVKVASVQAWKMGKTLFVMLCITKQLLATKTIPHACVQTHRQLWSVGGRGSWGRSALTRKERIAGTEKKEIVSLMSAGRSTERCCMGLTL